MIQCLVTKLKGKVNDSSLLKLGEMRLSINKDITPEESTRSLRVIFKKSTVLEALDGYFTDANFSNNLGKTSNCLATVQNTFIVSNEDCTISLNKYLLQNIRRNGYIKKMQLSFDIADLKYSSLTSIYLPNTQVSGDIAALGNLTNLTKLDLSNTKVSGDIAALKNLTLLTSVVLSNTQVSGDIAVLPENILIVYFSKNNNVTWSTRPSSYSIFSLIGANLGDSVDKMLINMANCTNKTTTSNNNISVFGTRTSASDAAVQTLQSKGYTVSIAPA